MKASLLQVVIVLWLSAGVFSRAALSDPNESKTAPAETQPGMGYAFSSLGQRIISLPKPIYTDSRDILATDGNLYWFLAAAGGSMALRQSGADDRVWNSVNNHRIIANHKYLDEGFYYGGSPGTHFALVGLWYLAGANKGDTVGQEQAGKMFEALAVTGFWTLGLKLAVDDRTPNGQILAWPSGHTSSSMCVASVLDEYYGPAVGIPAYIGAGFVGYRMMESGDHWASDVLFGAVLGYAVGHHVAGGKELTLAGFQVLPMVDADSKQSYMGIDLYRRF